MSSMQPYTLKRIGIAWATAFALELGRRGMEPASGPGDIVFLPLFSVFISLPVMLAVLFMGLVLFIPPLNRAWYRHTGLFWLLITAGIAAYLIGVFSAHHAHFTLHAPANTANEYLIRWAVPGGLCAVFTVCFAPLGRRPQKMEPSHPPAKPLEREENNLDRYLRKREEERRATTSREDR